jgi:hypothetical protein
VPEVCCTQRVLAGFVGVERVGADATDDLRCDVAEAAWFAADARATAGIVADAVVVASADAVDYGSDLRGVSSWMVTGTGRGCSAPSGR